jgi:hypothetical protein
MHAEFLAREATGFEPFEQDLRQTREDHVRLNIGFEGRRLKKGG